MLPAQFIERMRVLLGDEASAFFAALDQPPHAGLRANTLKVDPQTLQQRLPWPLDPVPWCPAGFIVDQQSAVSNQQSATRSTIANPKCPEGARIQNRIIQNPKSPNLGKHPYHAAGLYYLQEPSAMAVAEALDVRPGMRVLDLAAAPGGKATHIAALLANQGLLVANEIDGARVKALGENLERWGARNVVLTNGTPERLADHLGPFFDRVLLDAPCSGEGMFRKNEAAQTEWSVGHVEGCAVRQERILDHAARLVKQGGLLVYSTCTFAPEENERQIAAFLQTHNGWELIELPKQHGFVPGRPEWADPPLPELDRAVRLWPHRLRGEGHFIVALRKVHEQTASTRAVVRKAAPRRRALQRDMSPQHALALWHAFERSALSITLPHDRLQIIGDQLYLMPAERLDLGGLRVVRPGWWLGTFKPGRFEPSHALALALHTVDAQTTIDLSLAEAERYLHGETLDHPGPNGWTLITVDGWPLGWGKRTGNVVKNHYPKGLRWMG